MNNGRPLGLRKTVQLMLILTILAWATQTLLAQWGFGADVTQGRGESFVPPAGAVGRLVRPVTLEVRGEATVVGTEVRLRQIGRWSDRDAAYFAAIGDLVVLRLAPNAPYRTISVPQIKGILHDAGISLAGINFAGALTCTVERTDVQVDEAAALRAWAASGTDTPPEAAPGQTISAALPADGASEALLAPAAPIAEAELIPPPQSAPATTGPVRTLRDLLIDDLAQRTGLPADHLQVTFNPKDERVLALAEPLFRFHVEPQRARGLGPVRWDVTIVTGSGSQPVQIEATARAWQDQVVLARPLAARQIVQNGDVTERRVLTDTVGSDPLLTMSQIMGNRVVRDLKPGDVLTAKLIEPVPLVRTGQFVTITLVQGNVRIKTVGRAMDEGAYGQTVRVKNEATREVYQVVMTGPQTAEMVVGGQPDVASATGQ